MSHTPVMEEKRTKSAIRHKAYSIGEFYGICELLILRTVRTNPNVTSSAVIKKIGELFDAAKLNTIFIHGAQELLFLIGHLVKAKHLSGPDYVIEKDYYGTNINIGFNSNEPVALTTKGRHYMLSMPTTVKNAATRIMRPYSLLDRIAAAIPKIQPVRQRRHRRRRS
jgi:hypothetical protein